MRILLPENNTFNMEETPSTVGDDLRYCVLDYSDKDDVDFYFIPLIFLEQFERPAADLRIGPYQIQMPLDWSIMIADKHLGIVEIIDLAHINDREFDAFVLNPINGYAPEFQEIIIQNVYSDITWNIPKLKRGHILAVPLRDGPDAPCAFFVKDKNKLPEGLDISKVFA